MPAAAVSRPLRILVILGHPRGSGSLCGALAQAYVDGAAAGGAEVRLCDLAEFEFDPNVTVSSPKAQALEPGLMALQDSITWAEHLVMVYPTWWGTWPALLKGALDRVLQEGWSFEETSGGIGFEGRLMGRTAELITTMDTPGPIYSLLYGAPGKKALTRATLGFCGIQTVRHTRFGPVKDSDAGQRTRWIKSIRDRGVTAGGAGTRTRWQAFRLQVAPWVTALRLQFYPMTFIAYWVGALLAQAGRGAIDHAAFWLGYGILFAVEAATVFINEVYDYESDRRNRFYSAFTGGSRVLIRGMLTPKKLSTGAGVALAMAAALFAGLWLRGPGETIPVLVVFATLTSLAVGYTLPPLKLCHRGLGEITVGLTHSFGVILAGYVVQGGNLFEPAPWAVSVPLFFAVVCAITLADIPDLEADRAAGKRTLAVIFSGQSATGFAMAAAGLAGTTALVFGWFGWGITIFRSAWWLGAIAHGILLIRLISLNRKRMKDSTRIDGLIGVALAYILWFGLIPLFQLLL